MKVSFAGPPEWILAGEEPVCACSLRITHTYVSYLTMSDDTVFRLLLEQA